MIIVQQYYVFESSMIVPRKSKASISSKSLVRKDCLYSTKGGRVPYDCFVNDNCHMRPSCRQDLLMWHRDCLIGEGPLCTKDRPCTPCDLYTIKLFDGWIQDEKIGGCQACSQSNDGDCNFIEGVGPYCWKDHHRRMHEVVPCTKCCTDYQCDVGK